MKTAMAVITAVLGLIPCGPLKAQQASAPRTITRFYVSDSTVASGKILSGLQEHCQSAILTLDLSKADYTLQIQYDNNVPNPSTTLVLYDKNGDSLFQTETRSPSNAVKDACVFLKLEK
jgi:hypothetical protein